MKNIQVLVATMNQADHFLIEKMNVKTKCIVANQCDRNSVEFFNYKGNEIAYYNFTERGVGLNRNNALMRANADICLFADDDMVYLDNYCDVVEKAFEENPQADVCIFNLVGRDTGKDKIKKKHRVYWYNYLRYGTARIAVRLSSIKKNGIFFNQCFGGGTEYCHGEDNLFLHSCLKNGLKIVAVPTYIASLTEERESSWNRGYNDKYLRDQGALYFLISRRWWRLLCLQDAIRHCQVYGRSIYKAYKLMRIGAKEFHFMG